MRYSYDDIERIVTEFHEARGQLKDKEEELYRHHLRINPKRRQSDINADISGDDEIKKLRKRYRAASIEHEVMVRIQMQERSRSDSGGSGGIIPLEDEE